MRTGWSVGPASASCAPAGAPPRGAQTSGSTTESTPHRARRRAPRQLTLAPVIDPSGPSIEQCKPRQLVASQMMAPSRFAALLAAALGIACSGSNDGKARQGRAAADGRMEADASAVPGTGGSPESPPTLAVIEGTIDFITPLAKADPGVRYAIVLVSDGYPQGCSDNKISSVVSRVSAVSSKIPTYVIGVANPPGGPDTVSNLNDIAVAGATQKAFIIQTGDPQQTAADFEAAVRAIRSASVSCEFQI